VKHEHSKSEGTASGKPSEGSASAPEYVEEQKAPNLEGPLVESGSEKISGEPSKVENVPETEPKKTTDSDNEEEVEDTVAEAHPKRPTTDAPILESKVPPTGSEEAGSETNEMALGNEDEDVLIPAAEVVDENREREVIGAAPESREDEPETTETEHATESEPEPAETEPEVAQPLPEATETEPESKEADSRSEEVEGITEAKPESNVSVEITGAEPQINEAEAEVTEAESEAASAEPEVVETEPEARISDEAIHLDKVSPVPTEVNIEAEQTEDEEPTKEPEQEAKTAETETMAEEEPRHTTVAEIVPEEKTTKRSLNVDVPQQEEEPKTNGIEGVQGSSAEQSPALEIPNSDENSESEPAHHTKAEAVHHHIDEAETAKPLEPTIESDDCVPVQEPDTVAKTSVNNDKALPSPESPSKRKSVRWEDLEKTQKPSSTVESPILPTNAESNEFSPETKESSEKPEIPAEEKTTELEKGDYVEPVASAELVESEKKEEKAASKPESEHIADGEAEGQVTEPASEVNEEERFTIVG